jgi:putative Holliday junction resolvase
MPATHNSILALDVGAKRVGVAVASLAARLPRPLTTLDRSEAFFDELQKIIAAESIGAIVIGLPRGLDGQHTEQTKATEAFVTQLKAQIDLPIRMQDEALTSKKAKAELEAKRAPHSKGDIDALAATYILEDFMAEYSPSGKMGVK